MQKKSHTRLWQGLLLAYGLMMVYLLFFRGRGPVQGVPYWQQVRSNCNIRPFYTVGNYLDILLRPGYYTDKFGAAYGAQVRHAFINLGGNIGMFLPLGALLPACSERLRSLWKCLVLSFCILLLVESIQLFSLTGSFDIDDLILNLMGVALGYGLYRMAKSSR